MRLLLPMLLLGWCLYADTGICDTVRALVQNETRKQEIPAISVAIVQDNRVACSVSLGFADLEHRIPNTENSRHRLACSRSRLPRF